jgi:phospholipid transport system substrate-binding protein
MRKVFAVLLSAGVAALLSTLSVGAAGDPGQMVQRVTTQAIDIATTTSGAPRDAAFRQVLRNNFDLPHMARLILGPYWNQASEQQRARFVAALEAQEARSFGERLSKFAGYVVTIDKVVPQSNGLWVVNAVLSRSGGQAIRLAWDVHDNGQGPRIADIKISGVSMSMIKRSEFNSYIEHNGGTVEPLVRELEIRARATR